MASPSMRLGSGSCAASQAKPTAQIVPRRISPEAGDFSGRYALEGVEVLLTAGALACNADFHTAAGRAGCCPEGSLRCLRARCKCFPSFLLCDTQMLFERRRIVDERSTRARMHDAAAV